MKRKLKTIKQLLEDFPESYFDNEGDLLIRDNLRNVIKAISTYSFHEFGKEHDCDGHRPFLYEPLPEPKKLYAYELNDSSISFRESDSCMGLRRPEFDIEYPLKDEE